MVSVKPIDAPASVTLPYELPAVDLLILPREVSDGRGLYDDSVVTLAKQVRAAGATADYQHDASSRTWIGATSSPAGPRSTSSSTDSQPG